jgi:hypothetical protein
MRYETIKRLRAGEVINLDGLLLERDEGEIQPGDLYVAERNTGPHLLTVRKVVEDGEGPMGFGGYVLATTIDYPFDFHECVKVREAN